MAMENSNRIKLTTQPLGEEAAGRGQRSQGKRKNRSKEKKDN